MRLPVFFVRNIEKVFWWLLNTNCSVFLFFFPMFTLFWFSTTFTAVIALWMLILQPNIAAAGWWPCWSRICVFCLRGLQNFWLIVMHTSLGPGAQKFFRYKWRKVGTLPFFLLMLVNIVAWLNGLVFLEVVMIIFFWFFWKSVVPLQGFSMLVFFW